MSSQQDCLISALIETVAKSCKFITLPNIIVPEVVGGRADAAVCTGFKAFINYLKQEEGKLANHDLQKAPRRSFLSGQLLLVPMVTPLPVAVKIRQSSFGMKTGECPRTLRSSRLYEGMNITGVTSLTEVTIATLKALGAVELQGE